MVTEMKTEIVEFLQHSNWIEGVYDPDALEDAVKAWEYMETVMVLNIPAILECHRILMANLDPRIAGKFRECNVRVGEYLAPTFDQVKRLMEQWLMNFTRTETVRLGAKVFPCDLKIKKAHVVFEKIHPFEDGNGRVGRIIMNWQRVNRNLPVLVIREEERHEYYKWFRKSNG